MHFLDRNSVWGRAENVDRTSDLLLGGASEPPNAPERFLGRVQAYTAGYDREFSWVRHVSTALGGQVTFHGKPEFLNPTYGAYPVGVLLFVRFRPANHMH